MMMIRSLQCWTIVAAVASLSLGAMSLNSVDVKYESPGSVDLTALGTPNLSRYNGTYGLSVGEEGENGGCRYTLQLDFDVLAQNITAGDSEFQGLCAPTGTTGNASDGLPWHTPRRHWMKFPRYVFDTTGFDHVSVDWVPCGRAPAGFRKARYDLNFYTVTPEYRAFMVCNVFKIPSVCQYNQTSHVGRAQFSMPRLAMDPQYLANMPVRFQPDPEFPEAFQNEGLIHYDANNTPKTAEEWRFPTFLMSTHDASVVSWRAMIPHSFFYAKMTSKAFESQMYVYQTMMTLPSDWSTSFDGSVGRMSVMIEGAASMCGSNFDQAEEDQEEVQEYDFGFEDDGNATDAQFSENMIN